MFKNLLACLLSCLFIGSAFGRALTESPVPPNAIANQIPAYSAPKERDIEKEATAIKSIEEAKSVFRDILMNLEHCGTGSCSNSQRLTMCDYLCLLDIRLRGAITEDLVYQDRSELKVSEADLALFKRIYNSCKVTYYQYWNFPLFTHVNFKPSATDKVFIYKELGLAKYLDEKWWENKSK